MCSADGRLADMKKYALKVFEECVRSVSPRNIVRNALRYDSGKLYVNSSAYDVPGDVYAVGFGKAVLDMALEVERVLDGRLREAAVSVPYGTRRPRPPGNSSRVVAMEAARNNVPDRQSVDNTDRIADTVSRLRSGDLLVVLISGGGSALLCAPTVPLGDKVLATKLLSSAGASIEQLNAVRKALSRVKGGRLVGWVPDECPVVSLILSDVVGDPLTAIASGPTVPNGDADRLPMSVVDGFGLRDQMPDTVVDALLRNASFTGTAARFDRVHNHVIGNNAIALRAGVECAGRDFKAVLLTTSLRGDVALVSAFYSALAAYVCDVYADGAADATRKRRLNVSSSSVVGGGGFDVERLTDSVVEASSGGRGLCVLSGGEPTVVVRGSGLGGRNQELALRVAVDLDAARRRHDRLGGFDVLFFSGGTDGIDGPTDACGAFGYPALVDAARSRGLDPARYVDDNDSYGFYSSLGGGGDLLKIGHTGTNVMDVHVLIVKPK